ncbi:MAG: DMT family transporter [Pyrinomonadaceae bacterium]|nr:DMT family transporter [Pyrinomonadaceae bacterium]
MSSFFNNYFFIFLAILAGMAMPTQAVVNSKLADSVGNPVLAAFISFAVGTVALFVYILLTGVPLSNLATAKNAPLVAWVGGFLGAFFVSVMATIVPRIGVALSFSLAIAGQMLVTLLIDHFGWLGVTEKPINLMRVLGAVLITVGVVLIRRF